MADTPLPETILPFERPLMAAALQRAKRALLARPPATALDMAQGALLPLLVALGIDVYDLGKLRLAGDPEPGRAEYSLATGGEGTRIVTLPAGGSLPRSGSETGGEGLSIVCNGRRWQASCPGAEPLELDLFADAFATALFELVRGEGEPAERIARARAAAAISEVGSGPSLGAVARVTPEEIAEYAEGVRQLRGKLQVWFAGEEVEISSRSAFYYVLAQLALRHGREDAIPGEDLVRPPDEPPEGQRAKALERQGWYLLLDRDPETIEARTRQLLSSLDLAAAFTATHRGEPYPPSPSET